MGGKQGGGKQNAEHRRKSGIYVSKYLRIKVTPDLAKMDIHN